jgi:hypothetical protein
MKRDVIFAVSTILFSIIFLLVSIFNPARLTTIIGPNTWPNIIMIFLMGLGSIELVKTLFFRKYDDANRDSTLSREQRIRLLQLMLSLVITVVLLPYAGFLLVSWGLFIYLAMIFGFKNKKILPLVSLVAVVLVILLFGRVLSITLPRGVWIFESISGILY